MKIKDVISIEAAIGFKGRKPGNITKGLNATGVLNKAKEIWGEDDGSYNLNLEREMRSECPHVKGGMKFEALTRTQQMNIAKRMHGKAQQRLRANRLAQKTSMAAAKGKAKAKDTGETQKMFEFLIKSGYKFTQSTNGVQVYENSEGDRFAVSTNDGHFGHQGPAHEHMGVGLKDLKKQIDTKTKSAAVNKIYSKDKDLKAGGPGSGRYPKGSMGDRMHENLINHGYKHQGDGKYTHDNGSKAEITREGGEYSWKHTSANGKEKTGESNSRLYNHLDKTGGEKDKALVEYFKDHPMPSTIKFS